MTTRSVRQCTSTCLNGHSYLRPHLGDFAYGDFLVESPRGSYAVAETFRGPVWDEVVNLLREFPGYEGLDDDDRATVTQHVYGRTIDADVSGPYRFDPVDCPIRGGPYRSVADIEPPVWVDDVPFTTHDAWLALSLDDRRKSVAVAVREVQLSRDIARH